MLVSMAIGRRVWHAQFASPRECNERAQVGCALCPVCVQTCFARAHRHYVYEGRLPYSTIAFIGYRESWVLVLLLSPICNII